MESTLYINALDARNFIYSLSKLLDDETASFTPLADTVSQMKCEFLEICKSEPATPDDYIIINSNGINDFTNLLDEISSSHIPFKFATFNQLIILIQDNFMKLIFPLTDKPK